MVNDDIRIYAFKIRGAYIMVKLNGQLTECII